MILAKPKVAIASGHFNPFHVGHLRYLEAARKLADYLIVIVNTDEQIKAKGRQVVVAEEDRLELVRALRCVNSVILSVDLDRSVSHTLELIHEGIGDKASLAFVNGGDIGSEENCREAETCRRHGISMVFGVGGYDKVRSSSEIIAKIKES